MEEDNFEKLPVEERCTHKSWKARISGYTSLASLFEVMTDERSEEWNKYVPIVKNVFLENNDPALEKGLETILKFVLKAAVSTKIVSHIVAGLIKKCVASSRARTRDLALLVCLACIEIEKQKTVTDELLKGTETKNPKISVGCVRILTEIIRAFGAHVIPIDGIIHRLPVLLEDRDQNVRSEARVLCVELYRWIGEDLRTNLLKPELLKAQKLADIVSEIAKIEDVSTAPTRVLRSQQKIQPVNITEADAIDHATLDDQAVEVRVRETLDDLEPVEITSRIPEEFYTQVKSAKWAERKYALENFEKILSSAGKIQNGDFNEMFNILVNVISKDANITVVCLAVKCVTHFAMKLAIFFQYSSVVFRALLEKFKEKKPCVVQTLREALHAVLKSSAFELYVEDLTESLRNKNPNVKSEVALFLSQCFSQMSSTTMSKKSFKPLFPALLTCLSDQDPGVRDHSARALGVVMVILGEKGLSPYIKDLEKAKLLKIKECTDNGLEESNNSKWRNFKDSKKCGSVRTPFQHHHKEKDVGETSTLIKKTGNTLLKSANESNVNIIDAIPESTVKALSNKDWSIRLQAISELQKIVNFVSDISSDLGELGPLIGSRILDSNPKISTAAICLVTSLVEKIGAPFRDQLRVILPTLLRAVGDVKAPVRDAAVNGLTKIGENCGYSEIFNSEFLPESLKSGSNTTKVKLWRWLAETLRLIKGSTKEISKSDLENMLPTLFSSLEDKSAEIRTEASNAVEGFVRTLSLGSVIDCCEKFYGHTNKHVVKIILDTQNSGKFPGISESPAKMPDRSKAVKNPSPMVSRKRVTFVDGCDKAPLLDVNDLKNQRIIDEHKHKTAKWDFTTPREEFVELLKGLMLAANFSQKLINLMYHSYFRFHVKAMDLLTEEISKNSVGIVCNLDLILRWLTLRFFDGNPTVLSKSLDFIITALVNLKEANYCLLDSEAVAFVPYLIMKLGDSKENIQAKVKEALVNLTAVYPVTRLKKFLMDGLKSNIARQRANCLDVIASYINAYGDSVYLKEIDSVSEAVGKLLKDRDSSVKKKAFSVAVLLFDREGEKILRFIEKQAGEDFRLIEDRIRKLVASRPASAQYEGKNSDSYPPEVVNISYYEIPPTDLPQTPELPCEPSPEPIFRETNEMVYNTGAFQWDANIIQEIDDSVNQGIRQDEIDKIDLDFMKDDFRSQVAFQRPASTSNSPSIILSYLESISDDDLVASKNGIKCIDMILNSGRFEDVENHADALIQKLNQHLEKLGEKHYCEVLENYGSAFTLLITLCQEKRFIENFSENRLYDTLQQLLSLISDYKFGGKENEVYRKTVNTIILKILENSRKTPLMCGLLRMLNDTKELGGPMISGKLNELCMKCLWKLNRAQATWDEELDYAVIFSVIQKFLRGFPSPWWKSRPDDMSLRTVKTFLRTMVKLRGERVLEDVDPDDDCELRRYLSKLVKHLNQHEAGAKRRQNDMVTNAQNLMPSQAKELSDIFSDIALNSPGAIQKLSEFKRRNPLVDLPKILSTMAPSPAFFRYFLSVTEGTDGMDGNGETFDANPTDDGNFSKEVGRMWGKLKSLQERIDTLKDT